MGGEGTVSAFSELAGVGVEATGASGIGGTTTGIMGGKYPSFLEVVALGDMARGASSRRLDGRPVIIPLDCRP